MHSHLHSTDAPGAAHDDVQAFPAARRRTLVLLTLILVPLAALTIVGMLLLWPGGEQVSSASPGTAGSDLSHPEATVQTVAPYECPAPGQQSGPEAGPRMVTCATVQARLETGPERDGIVTVEVPAESYRSGLEVGDRIKVVRVFNHQTGPAMYAFYDYARTLPIGILAAVFALLVVAVARMRAEGADRPRLRVPDHRQVHAARAAGRRVRAAGRPGGGRGDHVRRALPRPRLLGPHHHRAGRDPLRPGGHGRHRGLGGVRGAPDRPRRRRDGITLAVYNGQVDLSGIVLCGIIVAGLGVLNDVTITQSSAVWELRNLAPERSARNSSPAPCRSAGTTSPRPSTPSRSRTPVPRFRSCC